MRLAALSLALAVGFAGVALAQTPGAKAAAARHENFKSLGSTFKGLNDELKKDAPDKAVMAAAGAKMKAASAKLPTWFPKGSGIEVDPKSEAKAEVWSDAAGFAGAVKNFQAEAGKLQIATASGDVAAIKAQARATGGACKGCHDKYRVPKDK